MAELQIHPDICVCDARGKDCFFTLGSLPRSHALKVLKRSLPRSSVFKGSEALLQVHPLLLAHGTSPKQHRFFA